MPNIEVTQPHPETGGTRVVIDGTDLSFALRSMDVSLIGSRPARVTIELAPVESHRLCMEDAELVIGEDTAGVLVRAGWTPPRLSGQAGAL